MSDDVDVMEQERETLKLAPLCREVMDYTRAKLPPGTHFSVLVEIPGKARETGRVLALSTDRQRMALRAAEWILSVLPDAK